MKIRKWWRAQMWAPPNSWPSLSSQGPGAPLTRVHVKTQRTFTRTSQQTTSTATSSLQESVKDESHPEEPRLLVERQMLKVKTRWSLISHGVSLSHLTVLDVENYSVQKSKAAFVHVVCISPYSDLIKQCSSSFYKFNKKNTHTHLLDNLYTNLWKSRCIES